MKAVARIVLIPLLLFSYFLSLLSPQIIGLLGKILGGFFHAVSFRKKVVTSNLELALGKELSEVERANLTRKIYQHIGTLFLEIVRNFSLTKKQMLEELSISQESLARIRASMANGKGAVFITGHIANWELFAMGTAAYGVPVSIVVKRMNNAISQVLIERQRLRTEMELIYSGGAIEQMKKHLARGRAIGFMVDQNITGPKGIRANFFGVPAASIRGLAKLVQDTGTNVVPICSFRLPSGKHEVFVSEPLPYLEATNLPKGSPERNAREEWLNTQQYQTAMETLIRMHLEQWMWIHRRWKTNRAPIDLENAHLESPLI
jgi:KDO2-lipid IV(A) lauroyltransferase